MTTNKNSLQEAAAEILKASAKSGHSDSAKSISDPKENDTGDAITKNTDAGKDYDKNVSNDTSEPTKGAVVKEPQKKLPAKDKAPSKKGKNPDVPNDGVDEEVSLESVFEEFLASLDENISMEELDRSDIIEMFQAFVQENFEGETVTEEDISSLFDSFIAEEDDSDEDDEDEDDDSDDDEDDDEDKEVKESVIDRLRDSLSEKIEFDVSEDIKAMFSGQDLSEEFTDKASTIFEAAVKSQIRQIQENLLVKYDEVLSEEIEQIEETYKETINDFLKAVVNEWRVENEVAIEHNLRNELTEEFISGLRNLFLEHYIDVPEEKMDVLSNMSEEIDELKNRLNSEIAQNVELYKYNTQLERENTFKDIVSESDLTLSQVEKLKSLSEDLEFDSAEAYSSKIKTLIESYWPKDKSFKKLGDNGNGEQVVTEEVNPEIDSIVKALSRKLPK